MRKKSVRTIVKRNLFYDIQLNILTSESYMSSYDQLKSSSTFQSQMFVSFGNGRLLFESIMIRLRNVYQYWIIVSDVANFETFSSIFPRMFHIYDSKLKTFICHTLLSDPYNNRDAVLIH